MSMSLPAITEAVDDKCSVHDKRQFREEEVTSNEIVQPEKVECDLESSKKEKQQEEEYEREHQESEYQKEKWEEQEEEEQQEDEEEAEHPSIAIQLGLSQADLALMRSTGCQARCNSGKWNEVETNKTTASSELNEQGHKENMHKEHDLYYSRCQRWNAELSLPPTFPSHPAPYNSSLPEMEEEEEEFEEEELKELKVNSNTNRSNSTHTHNDNEITPFSDSELDEPTVHPLMCGRWKWRKQEMSAITPTSSKFSSTSSSAASRKPSSLQETKSRVSFCQETQNDNNSNTINVKNSKDVNRVTCILPNIHSHNNNVAIATSGMTSELCQAKDGTEIIESQNNINEQNYTVYTEQLSLQSPSPSESLFPSPPHSLSQVSGLSYMEANRTASFKTWRFPFLGRNDKSLLVSPAEGAFAKTISRFSKHEEESCHEQQQQEAEKEQKEEKEEQQKEFASSSFSQCPQISALANDTYHSFNMSRPANRICKKSKSGSIKNNNNSNFTTTTTSSSNDNYTGSKNAKITNKRGSICNSASTITVYISAEKHHDSKVSSNVKVKHANEVLMKEKECECKKEECYSEEEQEQLQHQENEEMKDNKNYVKAEMQSEVSSALTTNKQNRSKRLSMRSELELLTTQSKDEEHNHCYCGNNDDNDDDDEDEEEREYERLLNMVYASYVRNMKRLKHNSHEEHSQTAGTMTKWGRESRAQKIPKNNNNTTKELASPHATSMLVFSRNKKVKPESEYQHYLQRESLMANSLTASTLLNRSASYYTHSTQWSHNHPNRQNSCTLPQNVHVLPCESNSFYTAIIQASSRGNVISPIPDYTSTYSSFSISSRHPSVSTSTSPFFQKRVIRSDILHKIEQRVLLQLTIFVKRLYTRLCHQNNFTNHVNSIGNNSNNSTTNNNNNNGNKNNKIELDQNHKTETAEQSSSRFVQITSNINIHDNIDNYSSSSAQKMINKAAATSITTTTSNVEAINANVMQESSIRSINNHEKSIISKNNSNNNNNNNNIDIRTSEQHVSLQSPVSQAFSTAESNLSRSIRYRRMLTPVVRLVKHCHMLDGIEREVDNENLDLVVFVGMRLMGWLEVVSLLGAGSFGQVFLCKDLRICDGHFVHPSEMCGEDFMYWNCSHEYLPFGNSNSVPLHAPLVAVKVVKSVPLFEKQSVVEAEMLVLIGAQTPSATSMTEANNLENTNGDNYTSSSNSNNNELERRNKSENVSYTGVNNKPAPASLHTVYTNKNNIIDNDHESDNSAKVNYSKCATVKEQKTLSSSSSSPSLAQEYLDAYSSSVINLYDTECNNYEHPPEADPRCAYVAKVLADGICYGHHCIVMERYGANLFEYIQHRNYHGLPLYQIQSIGKQLFSALSLLHNACHIVHADIKPENLLLTMDSCTGMRYANTNTKTTEANEQSSYIPLMHGCNNICYNEIREVENKCLIVAPSPLRVHVIEQSNYNDAEQDAEVALSKNEVKNNIVNNNSNINIDITRRSSNKIYKSIEQDNKQKPLIRIKLIDFSSSCYEDEACFSYIQSRYYRAPEVIVGARYGTPIDIWSAGCVLAELFLGVPLLAGVNDHHQLMLIEEIIGSVPHSLLNCGANTNWYYNLHYCCEQQQEQEEEQKNVVLTSEERVENQSYKLYSREEYLQRRLLEDVTYTRYFVHNSLQELIRRCPLCEEERRMCNRYCAQHVSDNKDQESQKNRLAEADKNKRSCVNNDDNHNSNKERKCKVTRCEHEKKKCIYAVREKLMHQRFLFFDLLRSLLNTDPLQRPTATKALQHPFFTSKISDVNSYRAERDN